MLLVVVVTVILRVAVNNVLGDTGISGYKGNDYCPFILYAKSCWYYLLMVVLVVMIMRVRVVAVFW